MAKLLSTEVKVFPSAFRGPTGELETVRFNPESRLTTEFNVTNLTNKLASKDSFVISWDNASKKLIFNLHGYYFDCNLTSLLAGAGAGVAWTNIYAHITILPYSTDEHDNTTYKAFTLVGADDGGTGGVTGERILDVLNGTIYEFIGLEFSNSTITPNPTLGEYELHLLTGGPSAWDIPTASKLKLKSIEIEDTTTGKNLSEELHTAKIVVTSVDSSPTVTGTLTVTGETNLNGGLKLDDDKFVVTNDTGATTIKGETSLLGGLKIKTSLGNLGGTISSPNTNQVTFESSGTSGTTAVITNIKATNLGTAAAALNLSASGGSAGVITLTGTKVNADIAVGSKFTIADGVFDITYTTSPAELTLTPGRATVNLFNTTATTINFGGNATTLSIGKSEAGTTTINNTTDSSSKSTGALVVKGGVGINNKLYVGGTINDLTLAKATIGFTVAGGTTSKTLTVSDTTTIATDSITLGNSKILTLSDSATFNTNTLTLASTKALTMQYAGLTIGAAGETGTITIKSDSVNNRTIKLAGDITTAGGLTTSGAYGITLTATNTTAVTLPTTGTLATLAGDEDFTNKTYEGLTISSSTGTLTLTNGKTLAVSNTLTFTGTDGSSAAFGAGGTVAYKGSDLTQFANTSADSFRGKITETTGTGNLVFAASPTLVTPVLGVATATSINSISLTSTESPYGGYYFSVGNGSRALSVLQNFTVGNLLTETGGVTIKSAGSSATTVIGPNGGTATLPAVTTAAGAMKMLIGTGDNSATWAVDVLKSSYGPTSYHGQLTVTTSLNGTIYRGTYSTSSLIFSRFFRPTTALTDLAKCAALTQLSFVVPYATAPNATFGTTTITLAYIPGQITSVQTDNYAAVSDTGGTQTGTGSKITISAVGVCTIDVATAKSGSGNFGESAGNLTLSGSIIQITE